MLNTTVELNDYTVARVIIDPSAEDPRTWNLEEDAEEGIFVLDIAAKIANRKVIVPGWFVTFLEIKDRQDKHIALRALKILRDLGANIPEYIGFRSYQGHTQGDWADLLIAGPTEWMAQTQYATFAAWARDEVYGIVIERKCPATGDWFTHEDDLTLYGVYPPLDGDEDFETKIREVAAHNFDLDKRPLSEGGELAESRQLIKNSVVELTNLFMLLEDQNGSSTELSNTAREIIIAQAKIITSLEEEVAELR